MIINKTTIDDIDLSICFSVTALKCYPTHREWISKCILEKRTCFVCRDKGHDIACAIVKEHCSVNKAMKLCYLFVSNDYRKRSVGTMLLKAVEAYALSQNRDFLYLTVSKKNQEMEAFLNNKKYQIVDITGDFEYVYMRELRGEEIFRTIHFTNIQNWECLLSNNPPSIVIDRCSYKCGSVIVIDKVDSEKGKLLGVCLVQKIMSCHYQITHATIFQPLNISLISRPFDNMLTNEDMINILNNAEECYDRLYTS